MKEKLGLFTAFLVLSCALLLRDKPALAQSCNAVDTWANMCTGTSAGNFFQANDGPLHAVYGASGWQAFFNDFPTSPMVSNSVFTAPSFSWVNQSNTTVSNLGGCVYLSAPKGSTTNLNMYTAAPPATPYNWTVPMVLNLTGAGDDAGIAIGNSTSGKWITLSLKGGLIYGFHMNSATSWHDTAFGGAYFAYMYPLVYRIVNDGTTLKFQWANDGRNFITVYSEALSAWLGSVDRNAVYVDANSNDYPVGGTFCGMNYN